MMKKLIYSMFLILSVVTLFTACQEKEKPPITPGTPEITREELQALVTEVDNIDLNYYTTETYNAMKDKLEAAKTLLAGSPSSEQIVDAYDKLLAAKNALVHVPDGTPVRLYIYNLIEDTVYVTQGTHFDLSASAIDHKDNDAIYSSVKFEYIEDELKTLTDERITVKDNNLTFKAKNTLARGTTVSLTVRSAYKTSISKTISLTVETPEELKSKFLRTVSDLPDPKDISYEHLDAVEKAHRLYSILSHEDKEDLGVKRAFTKLTECHDAEYNLPLRIKYSFNGDVCTLIKIEGGSDEIYMGEFEFVANGAFPAGVYTDKGWSKEDNPDGEVYIQWRLTLNGDKTGLGESREAEDPNGTGATEWKVDGTLTYTFDGNKNRGGMFILTPEKESGEELKLLSRPYERSRN